MGLFVYIKYHQKLITNLPNPISRAPLYAPHAEQPLQHAIFWIPFQCNPIYIYTILYLVQLCLHTSIYWRRMPHTHIALVPPHLVNICTRMYICKQTPHSCILGKVKPAHIELPHTANNNHIYLPWYAARECNVCTVYSFCILSRHGIRVSQCPPCTLRFCTNKYVRVLKAPERNTTSN